MTDYEYRVELRFSLEPNEETKPEPTQLLLPIRHWLEREATWLKDGGAAIPWHPFRDQREEHAAKLTGGVAFQNAMILRNGSVVASEGLAPSVVLAELVKQIDAAE